MSDIVEWLHRLASGSYPVPGGAMREAAAEIARLRKALVAEVEWHREVIGPFDERELTRLANRHRDRIALIEAALTTAKDA